MVEGGKPVTIEELQKLFPTADLTVLKPTQEGEVIIWLGRSRLDFREEKLRRGYRKKYRGDHHQHTHGIFALLHMGKRRSSR